MATVLYLANAQAVAQVDTITITGADAATTYKATINGKTVSSVGQATAANIASDLASAITNGATTIPEFGEVTATPVSGTILVTSNVPGVSFTLSVSVTGGTGTISRSTTTANNGPGHLGSGANYSTGALPGTGDTLRFMNLKNVPLNDGFTALESIALAKVEFVDCDGAMGLPAQNPLGYWEYRPTYIELDTDVLEFDCPNCPLARFDTQTNQTIVNVRNTGASDVEGLEAFLWKGVHSSNVFNLYSGSAGIAVQGAEVSTLATINQSASEGSTSFQNVGPAVTVVNIYRIGGEMDLYSGVSGRIEQHGDAQRVNIYAGAFPLIVNYADSGPVNYLSSGTITDMTIGPNRVFDCSGNLSTFTISNAVIAYAGSEFIDPLRKATWNGIKASGCQQSELKVNRGEDRTWLDS